MLESRHCGPCCRIGEIGRGKGFKRSAQLTASEVTGHLSLDPITANRLDETPLSPRSRLRLSSPSWQDAAAVDGWASGEIGIRTGLKILSCESNVRVQVPPCPPVLPVPSKAASGRSATIKLTCLRFPLRRPSRPPVCLSAFVSGGTLSHQCVHQPRPTHSHRFDAR